MTEPLRLGRGATNTEYERLAQAGGINLSDGHARTPLDSMQRKKLLGSVEERFVARPDLQVDVERAFLDAFFQLAGQPSASTIEEVYLTFSSSSAIKMAARACREAHLTVLLIEPCFDNIYHLLISEGVDVRSISEPMLREGDIEGMLNSNTALWLVQPNNPTGMLLSASRLTSLMVACATSGATFVCDFAFRMHSPLVDWDQYAILKQLGVAFMCFEDTGKFLSTQDLKAGVTVSSPHFSGVLHRLHDELLLSVSPVHLAVLTSLINDVVDRGSGPTFRDVVERNRDRVHGLVEDTVLEHRASSCENVPMEVLTLPPALSALEFWSEARRNGVEVLPGSNYYWSGRESPLGEFFRLPLARPEDEVEYACSVIASTLRAL